MGNHQRIISREVTTTRSLHISHRGGVWGTNGWDGAALSCVARCLVQLFQRRTPVVRVRVRVWQRKGVEGADAGGRSRSDPAECSNGWRGGEKTV